MGGNDLFQVARLIKDGEIGGIPVGNMGDDLARITLCLGVITEIFTLVYPARKLGKGFCLKVIFQLFRRLDNGPAKEQGAPAGRGRTADGLGTGGDKGSDQVNVLNAGGLAQNLAGNGVDALAHFGPAMVEDYPAALVNLDLDPAQLRNAVTNAAVLDRAGKPFVLGLVVGILDGEQGLFQTDTCGQHLAGGKHGADIKSIVIAELPRVKATLFAQLVDQTLQGETGLVDAEPAHGTAGDIVGIDGAGLDIHGREMIAARGMGSGPVHDRTTHRGIGAGIAEDTGIEAGEFSVVVAADFIFQDGWMPLGMHADGFGSGKLVFNRRLQKIAGKGGMALHGHVFLAAKGAAAVNDLDFDLFFGKGKLVGDFVPFPVWSLGLGKDLDAVFFGDNHAAFRFQKSVVNGGSGEGAPGRVGRGLQKFFCLPPFDYFFTKQVPVFMHLDRAGQCLAHVNKRLKHLILHFDQLHGGPGLGLGFRNH